MDFGTLSDGRAVQRVSISDGPLRASFLTLGALIHEVRLDGVAHSLTLGGETARDYEGVMAHFGAIMGPVANRISTARARLDGMVYELERNQDGRIHLHSGAEATHLQNWEIAEVGIYFGGFSSQGQGITGDICGAVKNLRRLVVVGKNDCVLLLL